MRKMRQSIFLVTIVFALLFAFTIPSFAFVNVAGTWGHTDENLRKDRVTVVQGTNGQILSLSGYVYYVYDIYSGSYKRSNNWTCNTPGESFLWNLSITEKIDYLIFRDGPFSVNCSVNFSASNASAATYGISGPATDTFGNDLSAFTLAGGPLKRLTVGKLVENGPPPPEPPANGDVLSENIGNGSQSGNEKDISKQLVPKEPSPQNCPSVANNLETNLPGHNRNSNVSDPVNTVSGNFYLFEIDSELKSRLSIKLIRNYNSLDKRLSIFGRGWSSPLTVNLQFNDSSVIFTNSDGSRIIFEKDSNSYVTPAGHDVKLTHSADTGLWSVSLPQGSEWFFNEDGKITRMVKACCGGGAFDAIDFEYDNNNNLVKVTNPSGQYFQFTVSDGLTTQVTDFSGRINSYEYNSNKDLVKYTDSLGRITNYSYNNDGFMTQITRPGSITTSIEYSDNRAVKITNPDASVNILTWDEGEKKLSLIDGTGVNHEYTFDENWYPLGYAVPSKDLSKTLVFSDAAVSGFTDSLGFTVSYYYNSDGYLKSITDKLGNVSTYEWHPDLHKLTKKTDALNRVWSYEWCARGNLVKETNPAGGTTSYTYDSHNNRTSKTDAIGHVTRYVYDATGNYLVQTIDAMGGISSFTYDLRGNLISSVDQLGRTTVYEYDLVDRLVKSTYPDGRFTQITYDEAGNISSRIDNLGRITTYTYDANGKLLTTTRPDGTALAHTYDASGRKTSSTDALGRSTSYEYDALDNMVKVTYPDQTYQSYAYDTEKRLISSSDELGNITAYEYDPMGRMLATIDPAGSRYENQYDVAGRKIAAKDPLGRVTSYEYDVLDRVVKTTAPDSTTNTSNYDAIGNLLISTNALNQQTAYEYDSLNRQVKTTRADGAQFATLYDAVGQVVSETDALGNSTLNAYDNAGRRISTTNALNHVWNYTYDNAGRLIKTTDPLNGIATMTYDVMDRLISESDALGRVSSYEYDVTGKRIARTDSMGRRSIFAYDSRDRLTTEVDGEGRIVSYAYDAAGRKTSLTDGAGRIWRWVYDSLGRVTAEIDPIGNEVKNSYDVVGNLILKTNARSQATGYEFDVMNRLAKINYPDTTVATFAYDTIGRELVRSGSAGVVEKAYDVAGNLVTEKFVSQNKAWNYSFDLMGNRIKAISPENETFKYAYDKLYRLIALDSGKASEKISYSYDALGRTIEEKRVESTTTNKFDAAGQLLEMKHYKLVLEYESHGCGKNRKKQPVYKEKILALRQYAYDLAGNRISMIDENGKTTSYAYDNSNWLKRVNYPNNDVVAYTYNDAGDRISEKLNNKAAVSYGYDAAGRMLTKGEETFSYDLDGNMLSDSEASYVWNSDNRLLRVEKTIGGCKHDKDRKGYGFGHLKHDKESIVYEEYSYLPQDWRRITRKTGELQQDSRRRCGFDPKSEEKTFVSIYDGNDESHEYELTMVPERHGYGCKKGHANKLIAKLDLVREFIGGPGTDDLEHTRYGKLSLAMLKDGLGSTIALTGREGQTIAKIGYDAWGNFRWEGKECKLPCHDNEFKGYLERFEKIRGFGHVEHDSYAFGKQFASKLTPYLYTGRRYSELTNQYWNRNRYYSPALGRFTSKDPISFSGGYNLYRYADNNPMRFIDPWGLDPYWPFGHISPERFEDQTGLSVESQEGALAYTLFVETAIQDPGEILGRYNQLLALFMAAGAIESSGLERFSVVLKNQAPQELRCELEQAFSAARQSSTLRTTRLSNFVSDVSDDALVHFSPNSYSVVEPGSGGRLFSFRYGDIKNFTPNQIETIIGPGATGGQSGGTYVMHVLEAGLQDATIRSGAVVSEIPEYIMTTSSRAIRTISLR